MRHPQPSQSKAELEQLRLSKAEEVHRLEEKLQELGQKHTQLLCGTQNKQPVCRIAFVMRERRQTRIGGPKPWFRATVREIKAKHACRFECLRMVFFSSPCRIAAFTVIVQTSMLTSLRCMSTHAAQNWYEPLHTKIDHKVISLYRRVFVTRRIGIVFDGVMCQGARRYLQDLANK